MPRKLQILLIAAMALPAWAGAASMTRRTAPIAPREWRDATDMAGRRVRLCAKPSHILSLCTSATDTLVALGAGDRLAAIDEFSRIVPRTDRSEVLGRGSAVSREMTAALGIDLAFVWWYQDDAAEMLDNLGVPVVRIRAGRAADLPDLIRLIGDCVGSRPEAEASAARVQAFLDNKGTGKEGERGEGRGERDERAEGGGRKVEEAVASGQWSVTSESTESRNPEISKSRNPFSNPQSPIPNPSRKGEGIQHRVFIELYGPLKTTGRDTFINDLLNLAGLKNIAGDVAGSVQFSAERLVEADPDIILCLGDATDAALLAARPGMDKLRAVREGRVAAVDRYWFVAGPHIEQSVEKIRNAIP